jgi:hypothetical protein
MYYKIQASLGNASAVPTETIPTQGICIELKNFSYTWHTKPDPSIVIYTNGVIKDLSINGWSFPCVYNKISYSPHDDIRGGKSAYSIDFECIDPNGNVQKIEKKSIYGSKEAIDVEYFYTLLYNISCCHDIEQYNELYTFIIDNEWFSKDRNRKDAIQVLGFIESFTPQLSELKNKEYLVGLKQKINIKFKEAKEIISESNCPD